MNIERIRIDRFGGIEGFDSGEAPLPRLIAVQGPNEAGKSSLFHFLTSMLYGFYPASRDTNPYSPWSGREIDGRVTLRLDDGRLWEVHRRLLSAPWGRLGEGGREEDIRNQNLSFTEGVPRDVFRQIYALTLGDLASLTGDSWDAVQERLIGSMGASDLLSPRQSAGALEREAKDLWRPDRVGQPLTRRLKERLAELHESRRIAKQKDEEVREKVDDLARLRDALREARSEREDCRRLKERIGTLLPIRQKLQRVAELRDRAGCEKELHDLSVDVAERMEELSKEQEELEEKLRRLDEEEIEPRGRIAALEDGATRILRRRDEIMALVGRTGEVIHAERRLDEWMSDLAGVTLRCNAEAEELFVFSPGEAHHEALDQVAPATLRAGVRVLREAVEEVRRRAGGAAGAGGPDGEAGRADPAGRRPHLDPEPGSEETAWPTAAMAGGACLLVVAVILLVLEAAGDPVAAPGWLILSLLLLGALLLQAGWYERRKRDEAQDRRRTESERVRMDEAGERALRAEAAAAEASARARLSAILGGLPLRPNLLDDPRPEVAEGIIRLQELSRKRREIEAGAEKLLGVVRAFAHDVASLEDEVGLDYASSATAGANILERQLRQAEEVQRDAAAGEREVGRIERARQEIEERRSVCNDRLRVFEERLETLGNGDRAAGLLEASTRLSARDTADRIEAELERATPDLHALKNRIAEAEAGGESWTVDEAALSAATVREEELSHQVEELRGEEQALERDIEHLGTRETVDGIDGAIAEIRDEMGQLERERDRKIVLARLLRKADRDFRDAHQPDIIRRTAGYMTKITGGRYDGVAIGEEDRREVFYLRGPDHARSLAVEEPISTGTREQFHLALRLAIVDHLDSGRECLPLFMDEAFVNWDAARRRWGFDLLRSMSAERQIFVFTCHESMMEELICFGAHPLSLPGR